MNLRIRSWLMQACLILAPWVGMGLIVLSTGQSLGTGIQPAFVPATLLMLLMIPAVWRSFPTRFGPLWLALGWTALGLCTLWRIDVVGQVGEWPALKGLKQFALLLFFVAVAMLPAFVLARAADPWAELSRWERAVSFGLVFVAGYALLQAANFYLGIAALETVDRWFTSNPSIESGSGELYLGHRFVGIPRARSTFCEPLQLGSYLVCAVPICAAAGWAGRGWSRLWRLLAALAGTAALALTFSRGAYLGAFVVMAFLALGWLRGPLPRPRVRVLVTSGAVALLFFGGLVSALIGRMPWELPGLVLERLAQSFATHDMSNMTRLYAWNAAWRAFLESPIIGIGWGGFGFQYYTLAPPGGAGAHFGWPMTNNLPLLILAETGAVGALCWAWAGWPAIRALRGLPEAGRATAAKAWAWGLAALCIAVLVQGLTFSQWNQPHLWLLAGASAALGRMGREPAESLV